MFGRQNTKQRTKQFFENLNDENFVPNPEKSDKSFLRK
jgi:hypothetical protein